MKLALLGSNAAAISLVRTICADEEHQLAAVYNVEKNAAQLHELAPRALRSDNWESLLLGTVADAVIVANDAFDSTRADQLRKLVQAAIPLLVFHPCCEAIIAFELDMIRADTDCVLVPYIPGRKHPVVSRACTQARSEDNARQDHSRLGKIEQLVFERTSQHRNRELVLCSLARDVNLISALVGDLKQVSAMDSSSDQATLANLSVNMNTADNILARWSIGPAGQVEGGRLVLRGLNGELILNMPDEIHDWSLRYNATGQTAPSSSDQFQARDDHREILLDLQRAIQGVQPEVSWSDACRDLGVVSAVEQSVRRGRTIDIYQEEHSEEQTFKGIMAVGSCGILFAAFLFLLGLAVFEGLTFPLRDAPIDDASEPGPPPARAHLLIRLWPFYPFAVFLLLQLLQLVFRRDTSESERSNSGSGQTGAGQDSAEAEPTRQDPGGRPGDNAT